MSNEPDIAAFPVGNQHAGYRWIAHLPALANLNSPTAKADTKEDAIAMLKAKLKAQREKRERQWRGAD